MRAFATAQPKAGTTYRSPTIDIAASCTLTAEQNIEDAAFALRIVVGPATTPNRITVASHCPWNVTFYITENPGSPGSPDGIEVGPGETREICLD